MVATTLVRAQVEAVQPDAGLRQRSVWLELEGAWRSRAPVFGRVLNQCPGGYAVGLGGLVGLLPYARATTRTALSIGTLAPFLVDHMSEGQRLVVVRDAREGRRRG